MTKDHTEHHLKYHQVEKLICTLFLFPHYFLTLPTFKFSISDELKLKLQLMINIRFGKDRKRKESSDAEL